MRAFLLIASLMLLSACVTSQVDTPPPAAVVLSEDLHFKWVPPNLGHEMEISISAGRYTRSVVEGNIIYYESANGLVSGIHAGQPAMKTKGGIGYSKGTGHYFVWKLAPSIYAQSAWAAISNLTQEGPLVQIYLGQVPKEIEHSLRLEK